MIKLDSKKSVCLKLEMLYRNKHLLNKNLKQSKKFALKNFSLNKIKKIHTEIYEKFKSNICVVGLGYVGLPLAIAFGKNLKHMDMILIEEK